MDKNIQIYHYMETRTDVAQSTNDSSPRLYIVILASPLMAKINILFNFLFNRKYAFY
jgi:hypothetical protein